MGSAEPAPDGAGYAGPWVFLDTTGIVWNYIISSIVILLGWSDVTLNGGNLTMASSCARLIVVIPCMLGSKLSMRAGSEHTSVSCVLRAIAALSTSISRWDKAVKSFQMSIWWSGKESKKSWSSWEGPSCRKDSGQVEVSPLLMASSSAWPPPHLVHRWLMRVCICGGTELSSLTGSGPQNCRLSQEAPFGSP